MVRDSNPSAQSYLASSDDKEKFRQKFSQSKITNFFFPEGEESSSREIESMDLNIEETCVGELDPMPTVDSEEPEPSTEEAESNSEEDEEEIAMTARLKPEQIPEKFKLPALSDVDPGLVVKMKTISDAVKLELLTSYPPPPRNYKFFPVVEANRNRQIFKYFYFIQRKYC